MVAAARAIALAVAYHAGDDCGRAPVWCHAHASRAMSFTCWMTRLDESTSRKSTWFSMKPIRPQTGVPA